ncbi:putative glycosyl hydrolase family 79 C-terminal beta domain [Lyophyllum shimeji]|uniref:Glycosyl hydrolase family 79 C-terminal beta domain n=1 Tax=Lyophyllum shimeji TaxID=47721 RepID=A0A9P3PRA3_LYOSH|nr:putative glycosyl hydrolase family 79 C-terminal beta domain [Lyophyllum shimeji]
MATSILRILCVALLGKEASGVNVAIPLIAPSTAPRVSPSLFSFSIEQDRWTDWAGSTSRNQFLFNTLDNLARLTGAPPDIRIGANSEDHTKFKAAIQTTQSSLLGMRFIRQLNFFHLTLTLYGFVQEWTYFATNISAAMGISSTSHTKFWGVAFAGAQSSHSLTGWSPQSAFKEGLLNSAAGSLISTVSQHHYSGSFCSGNAGLLQDLMTKSTIRANLSLYLPDIAATRGRGLDYVLGETNSYSCHGAPGVSNSADAALWRLDYALYATQIGISKVFFHQGVGFKYNHIQPATLTRSTADGSDLPWPLPPHVQPAYYGAIT